MSAPIHALEYVLAAIILLRLSGKKTLSQMTPGEVVIILGLGTVLVHPLKNKNEWMSLYHGTLIVISLLIFYYLFLFFPNIRRLFLGNPIILIKDGEMVMKNLKKTTMSVDELKMRLRIKKVNDVSKVRMATLEVSGDIGIELYPDNTPITKKDLENFKIEMLQLLRTNAPQQPFLYQAANMNDKGNLFDEVTHIHEPIKPEDTIK